MIKTVQQSDFKTLREAYLEVKKFIQSETMQEVKSLNTKIDEDLSWCGDDNYGLIQKFIKKYKLDFAGFDYSKHFLSEGEFFGSRSGEIVLELPAFLFFIVAMLVYAITFGKVNFTRIKLFPEVKARQTIDMTFGDMLTWYLTGRYSLRTDVRFQLANAK